MWELVKLLLENLLTNHIGYGNLTVVQGRTPARR